jgi:hypothetical protein
MNSLQLNWFSSMLIPRKRKAHILVLGPVATIHSIEETHTDRVFQLAIT